MFKNLSGPWELTAGSDTMDDEKARHASVQRRLQEAEAILEALGRGEIDMLIGPDQPLVVRFRNLEQHRERYRKMLATVRSVNRILMKAREPADLLSRAAVCLVSSGLIGFAWMGLTGQGGTLRWSVGKKGAGFADSGPPADTSSSPACAGKVLASPQGIVCGREEELCRRCGFWRPDTEDISFVRRFDHRCQVFGLMIVTGARELINDPGIQRLLNETSEDLGTALFRLGLEKRFQRDRRARARLVAALDQAKEGIVVFTSDGEIQYANSAFAALLKQPAADLEKINLVSHQEGGEYGRLLELIRQVVTERREWAGRVELAAPGGSVRHLGGTISPVLEGGDVPSFVAIFNDVTELVTMERQMQQSQKMESIGRLAGGIAHDFNNMLSVIGGYAELGMLKLNPGDPLLKDLTEIKKASERSAALTRQLLAFSRQQTAAPQVVDLNQLLSESRKMLRRLIREEIELKLELDPDLWPVYIDPSQVDQIVMNLVVNARDAIEEKGTIGIATANVVLDRLYCRFHPGISPGNFVMLSVSDNGCGMEPDVRRQVFEPFFTTKAKGVGTGLGLSTVYGIVKQNQGAIYVYSEPGRGSVFKIYLPQFRGKEQQAGETDGDRQDLRGRETLLVVEDEAQVRRLAVTALRNYGYNVLEAPTVEAAVELAEKHPGFIDLLITDVIMPSMDGKQLQARIVQRRPGIKTLFMSGYASDTIILRGVLEKGIHFIQKPFAIAELARKVRQVLDAPA